MQKRFYYIFGGTKNKNTEPSSITLSHRDYKKALDTSTHKFLNEISDYDFPEDYNNKDYFCILNLNGEIPIYLDKKLCRIEEHKITWQDLNKRISELKSENQFLKIRDDYKQAKCLDGLIKKLQAIRDNHKSKHQTPSPNDIVTFKEEIDLLGYYTRNGRNGEPEIVLLMETLENQPNKKNAIATTLIHEMFHAYYDHDLNKKENILPYVEEPLTEYAMLKFVDMLYNEDKKKYSKLFEYAKKKVRQKQYSLGIAHYGFGYYLWEYEQKYGASINWIKAFRNAKYKIAESQQEYKNYAAAFERGIYPFWDEYRQMKLLQVLLNKNK